MRAFPSFPSVTFASKEKQALLALFWRQAWDFILVRAYVRSKSTCPLEKFTFSKGGDYCGTLGVSEFNRIQESYIRNNRFYALEL